MQANNNNKKRGWILAVGWAVGCLSCARHNTRVAAETTSADVVVVPDAEHWKGMHWARLADMPDGMHVQLWMDVQGTTLRGAYRGAPWSGELFGTLSSDATHATVELTERGATTNPTGRTRTLELRWNAQRQQLEGKDETGRTMEIVRASFQQKSLKPGVWLAFWTGLPPGVAVETHVTQSAEGTFHAAYSFVAADGPHEGLFRGVVDEMGTLSLQWREVNNHAGTVRGTAQLRPHLFGYRGTYFVEGNASPAGEWMLEPWVTGP